MINLSINTLVPSSKISKKSNPNTPTFTRSLVSSYISNLKTNGDTFVSTKKVDNIKPVEAATTSNLPYKNNLKSMFKNNEVVLNGIVVRTFNAKDKDGDGLVLSKNEQTGTFLNAIDRLDEIKSFGINALHLLPIHPQGHDKAMGNAGSLYAMLNPLKIDPNLDTPDNATTVKEEMKKFVQEAHKRNIKVMVDLPSCVSVDFYKKSCNAKYMAKSRTGAPLVPQGWDDIRMFKPFSNVDNRQLNDPLLQLHKDYVDMLVDLGVDGVRVDVARAKPPEFWDDLLSYTKTKDPEFAWLAETYTYEDASPMINMPKDRPRELLNAGFDSFYGQFHIFDQWLNNQDLHKYIKENIEMSHQLEPGKSLIGSFGTHDDVSLMYHGGVNYTNLVSGIMLTLPMTNPYFIDGYLSGDKYQYDYEGVFIKNPKGRSKKAIRENMRTYEVHSGKLDIFNTSRKPGGKNPEIGEFFKSAISARQDYQDVITKGSTTFLYARGSQGAKNIVSYARHQDGKTLLVVANRNMNHRRSGVINIPGFLKSQQMNNLVNKYGENSYFQPAQNALKVDLAPGTFYLFEINTPMFEQDARSQRLEVLRQNL